MNKDDAVQAFTTLEAAHKMAVSALRDAGSRCPEIGSVSLLLCDLGEDLGEVPLSALASRQTETDGLVEELRELHEAARGRSMDLVPADGPIARLTLFMHENGDRILTALSKTRVDALEEADSDELHDLLCTAIDDSMDMGWQSGWAADSIFATLEREGMVVMKAAQPCKHGHFGCSECSV